MAQAAGRQLVVRVTSDNGTPSDTHDDTVVAGATADIKSPGVINDKCTTGPDGTCAFDLPQVDAQYVVRLHAALPNGLTLTAAEGSDQRLTVSTDGTTTVAFVVSQSASTASVSSPTTSAPASPTSTSSNSSAWLWVVAVAVIVVIVVAVVSRRRRPHAHPVSPDAEN